MTIDNEEVLSNNDISIKEEILSPSSTILNNVYPKSWELDKDYTSRFYYPKDYSKLNIQNFSIEPEEAGKTIQVNGSATLTDVDTSKESRVLRLLGQTSQNGTPTPSSPIPINVVSGDNTIDIVGKNLLPQDKYIATQTTNGITYTNNGDGTFNLVGTASANTTIQIIPIGSLELIANQPYYLYSSVPYNSSTFNMSIAMTANGSSKFILANNTYTPTATPTNERLQFYIANGQSINQSNIKLMLVKGSTAPTTYEPYIGNSYPIYLGVENLWTNPSTIPVSANGNVSESTTTRVDDNTFIINMKKTSTENNSMFCQIPLNVNNFKPNTTYTISKKTTIVGTQFSNAGALRLYMNGSYGATTNSESLTFTTPSSLTSLAIVFYGCYNSTQQGEATITIDEITLEVGTKANHASTTPIELCKIGTYQDYIYKDNGSWYLHKEIGKVVLNGTESWQVGSSATNRSVFSNQTTFVDRKNTSSYSDFYCDNFSYLGNAQGEVLGYAMSFNSGQYARFIYVQVPLSVVAQGQIDDFKNWLSTHNTIVYYILATPTNTEITDTTLLEQLDDLESQ